MITMLRRFATVVVVTAANLSGAPAVAEPPNRDTSLRVAIVLDRSGTYRDQSGEAVAKATALLDQLARTRVHRWEAGNDRIALISLDALPSVLWRGTLEQLRQLDHAAWNERLAARRDFEHCTDVVTAFQLAGQELDTNARFVDRYIVAFSDLIDEPPTHSVRACQPPLNAPAAHFPWDQLRTTSVSIFWVPANQVLRWRRAVAERGLDATFVLHSVSESATVSIPPPPRPTVVIDPAEQAADRARFLAYGAKAGRVLAGLALGGTILAVVLILLTRRRHPRRRAARRPAHGHGPADGRKGHQRGERLSATAPTHSLRRPGS